MKKLLFLMLLCPLAGMAQNNDLLSSIDTDQSKSVVDNAFKSLKIVNLESTKLASKKDFYMIVSHRFGSIKGGVDEFFGLDNATINLKFLYGITNWLNVSASRSSLQKMYDLGLKTRLMPQEENGFPVAIVMYNSLGINTALSKDLYPELKFANRLNYVAQLLVSRKMTEKLSLEIAPTFFHENFVQEDYQNNSQFAVGLGGRYKVSKRIAFTADYAAHMNRLKGSSFVNPLSFGCDIDTGGHIFQLHFTNARAMYETGYLGNSTGNWEKGDIYFGFNLVRVF